MSYDLNILVQNQEEPSVLPFPSLIQMLNEKNDEIASRYHSIWRYMTQSKGIWYSLVKENNGILNAFPICDSDFEADEDSIEIPYWVSDDSIKYNLTPLIVYEEYRRDFEKIIEFLIKQSPNRTVMFLARYQGGEHEIVCGVLKYEEFTKLLNQSKILFNVCYIIND
ncbi:hypothetical protein [Lutispora sp.]|uniref:hypothetical protein n=1 Tax=Lutispora sp. TaxID=2828727 RepID=UPI002B21CA80|nr:hypothetical protein [Lutispora sp.]MEA4963963.1 hypothetical protein [Lutispora sp.]